MNFEQSHTTPVSENQPTAKQQRLLDVMEAFKIGGGTPDVQEAKLKVIDLEKWLDTYGEKNMEDDDVSVRWMETELKLWRRLAESKPVEGETPEEQQEYKQHVGGLSEDEKAEAKKNIDSLKMAGN